MVDKSQDFAARNVLVAHPGVQHSRELVRALYQGGLLSQFFTSFSPRTAGSAWLPGRLRSALRLRVTEGVPCRAVTTVPYLAGAIGLVRPLLSSHRAEQLSYAGYEYFDKIVSESVLSSRPRVVVGFENSCRHSFRNAKSIGAICVLDAASVHFSAQPANDREIEKQLSTRINARKEEEIQLADHIVVLSSYALETYVSAGVSPSKISVIAPGVWFPSHPREGFGRLRSEGVRFLFVGNIKRAKGIDLLLDAYARLDAFGKSLILVGPAAEAGMLPDKLPAGAEYRGRLSREAVYEVYSDADVLVLPSRADGFGFVVAEAMRCGLPVIVSSATGAKDLVEEGRSGWVFESANSEDLLSAMAEANARRDVLAEMGGRARRAVESLTWDAYGNRVREFYSRLLAPTQQLTAAQFPSQ